MSLFESLNGDKNKIGTGGLFSKSVNKSDDKRASKEASDGSNFANLFSYGTKKLNNDQLEGGFILSEADFANGDSNSTNSDENIEKTPENHESVYIKLTQISKAYQNRQYIRNQFSKLGNISKIVLKPNNDSAVIHFSSPDIAYQAKRWIMSEEGRSYFPNVKASIARSLSKKSENICFTEKEDSNQMKKQQMPVNLNSVTNPPITSVFLQPSNTEATLLPSFSTNNKQLDNSSQLAFPQASVTKVTPAQHYKNFSEASLFTMQLPKPSQFRTETKPGNFAELERRLKILEKRDELDRKIQSNSQTNLIGTCPDMCPEIERYLRAVRNQISFFEATPESTANFSATSTWVLDHNRAVKDYSRSSADQALPLSRDLRPTPVLTLTINYLLAAIVDRPEMDESRNLWKAWYEFLWTRTRAIRKDIVQQRLCNPDTSRILEIIVRFHIFAAVRLLDGSCESFDQRINSENLTKCLQTLKEMYSDLRDTITDDITFQHLCPNESEFRAYMILMKLNDNNVLDEVEKLSSHVRKSYPVEHAVSVYHAAAEHNYIRFFRLLREGPLLSACVMHRYCSQIRGEALIRMADAFNGHPRREVLFPLSVFLRNLAFENDKDALDFCASWQIKVIDTPVDSTFDPEESKWVIFDKFNHPIMPTVSSKLIQVRPLKVIESRRGDQALSTLFNGGLAIYPSWAKPKSCKNSFSDQEIKSTKVNNVAGFIMQPSFLNLVKPNQNLPTQQGYGFETQRPFPTTSKVKPSLLATHAQLISDEIFNDIFKKFCNESLPNLLKVELVKTHVARKIESEITNQVIEAYIYDFMFEMKSKEKTRILNHATNILVNAYMETEIMSYLSEIASSLFKLNKQSVYIFYELLHDFINEECNGSMVKKLANEFYRTNLIGKCFKKWKEVLKEVLNEKEMVKIARSMPGGPSMRFDPIILTDAGKSHICGQKRKMLLFDIEVDQLKDFIYRPLLVHEVWQHKPDNVFIVSNSDSCPIEILVWLEKKLEILQIPFRSNISEILSSDRILCIGTPPKPEFLSLLADLSSRLALIHTEIGLMDYGSEKTRYFLLNGSKPDSSWVDVLLAAIKWLVPENIKLDLVEPIMKRNRVHELKLSFVLEEILITPLNQLKTMWNRHGFLSPFPSFLISCLSAYTENLVAIYQSCPFLVGILKNLQKNFLFSESKLKLEMDTSWEIGSQIWIEFLVDLQSPDFIQSTRNLLKDAYDEFLHLYGEIPLACCIPWIELFIQLIRLLTIKIHDQDIKLSLQKFKNITNPLVEFVLVSISKDSTFIQLTIERAIELCRRASEKKNIHMILDQNPVISEQTSSQRLMVIQQRLAKIEYNSIILEKQLNLHLKK